jgi:predicted glycoside hydrolase/deacetylase ChbG (UPF0249 family)
MSDAPERRLALCADDFGLTVGILRATVRLARAGRLQAVSCIVTAPRWSADAALLADLPRAVDVGLHLNLTEGTPCSAALAQHWGWLPSLPRLIALAHLRRLPMAALRDEIAAQFDAFSRAVGRAPAFVDGHQHVHHLPGIRDALLDMRAARAPMAAVRNSGRVGGAGFGFKRWLIERTGGRALQRLLQQRGILHNAVLLGAYDFAQRDYRALMQGWLAQVPAAGALLFCHPGDADDGSVPDSIAAARQRESAYLDSDAFMQDVACAGIVLGAAWRVGSAVSETSTNG